MTISESANKYHLLVSINSF